MRNGTVAAEAFFFARSAIRHVPNAEYPAVLFGGSAMHLYLKTLLSAVVLFAASCSIAQEWYRTPDPDLRARISYDNSGVVMGPKTVRHVCVAVSADGDYRVESSLNDGAS